MNFILKAEALGPLISNCTELNMMPGADWLKFPSGPASVENPTELEANIFAPAPDIRLGPPPALLPGLMKGTKTKRVRMPAFLDMVNPRTASIVWGGLKQCFLLRLSATQARSGQACLEFHLRHVFP